MENYFADVDDNAVASNAGNPMDNTEVDMTQGAPDRSSEAAASEVAMPGKDSADSDVDADSANE